MWEEVMSSDLLTRSRLSRIYYNNKFFYYPLKPFNTLFGLGIINCMLILLSYFVAHLFPYKNEDTLEEWVTNRFGKRLYLTFFKTYTEKVWGIPCSEIRAEWAAQRIKGLSLVSAIRNALVGQNSSSSNKAVIKTLIDSFKYPRIGPGMMWDAVADSARTMGSEILMNTDVTGIILDGNRIKAVKTTTGDTTTVTDGTDFISTMPVRELICKMTPPPPDDIVKAAEGLNYRDFLTVALIVERRDVFPDNWIYIHDPKVRLGRVQNFKNWSPYMVPDPEKTCLGLEYFCFEGDDLWTMDDADLIELGKRELEMIDLVKASEVTDGSVVRVEKAYPVYDSMYAELVEKVRGFVDGIDNLQLVGRNGMHRYNNQDHSMLTAMFATENILGAEHDLWNVNEEKEYHEEATEAAPTVTDEAIIRAFSRMDKFGFAAALGATFSIIMFIATLWLVIKGGDVVGPTLSLLGQYFIGYTVTVKGAFIGMAYTFFWFFLLGWFFAYMRNASLGYVVYRIKKRRAMLSFRDFVDHF
jgi:protoporphyrinogen oxidase